MVTHVEADASPRRIVGLRDPLATDPAAVLRRAGDVGGVTMTWRPWRAPHPPWIAARFERALELPPGVRVSTREGSLTVTGVATARWFD